MKKLMDIKAEIKDFHSAIKMEWGGVRGHFSLCLIAIKFVSGILHWTHRLKYSADHGMYCSFPKMKPVLIAEDFKRERVYVCHP